MRHRRRRAQNVKKEAAGPGEVLGSTRWPSAPWNSRRMSFKPLENNRRQQPITAVWQHTSRRGGVCPAASDYLEASKFIPDRRTSFLWPGWTSEGFIPSTGVTRCKTILSGQSQCRSGVSVSATWMKELCHTLNFGDFYAIEKRNANRKYSCEGGQGFLHCAPSVWYPWGFLDPAVFIKPFQRPYWKQFAEMM